MKKLFLLACLSLSLSAAALPLSPQARQEADLFNHFLEAAYAQRRSAPDRFELLKKVLEKQPDSAYLKEQLVSEALAADQPDQADPYADFLDPQTADAQSWAVYGAYQWRKNNNQKAIEAYEKALELDPEDEAILYQYVAVLADFAPEKAAKELTELARSRPQIAPEIYTEIGRMYLFYKNYPAALEALNKAVSLNPQDPRPRLLRAAVYEKSNQYFLMLHELEELEKEGYATAQTLAQMGSVFMLVKDFPKAEQYFLKAKELENGHLAAGFFLSALAEQRGDYARAITYLQDTSDYATSFAKQVQVSYFQRKLNQPQESFKTIERAYKQFPDQSEVLYLYAVALYEQGKYAKSARVLAALVEKFPDNQEVRLQYAFALEGQKKYSKLDTQLEILLEQNPQHAAALNLYAYSLALRNTRLDEASKYIAQALALYPQDASFIDTQAWIFYKQGKYTQAADLIRSIPEDILRQDPEMAYHAGVIYVAVGQASSGRQYLQLAADGNWKEAQKALKKLN